MSETLPQNPYIVGPPVTGATLYGREDTLRFVLETLAMPTNRLIVLHGQRRVGKTSILQELHLNRLFRAGFYSAYFNPQGLVHTPFAMAIHEMAAAIAEALKFSKPELAAFEQDENYFLETFLPQALRSLNSLNGKRLVILIDECDLLSGDEENGSGADKAIRKKLLSIVEELVSDERWEAVAVISAIGRRIERLSPAFAQLCKAGHMHRVWLLSPEKARDLIIQPAQGILKYEPAAIEAIMALTSGHPYFIQLLCSEAFNHARWRRRDVVLAEDLEPVAAGALETGAPALAWLWDDLSMAERLIVSAFSQAADESGLVTQSGIESTLAQHRVRLGSVDLVQAVNQLVENRILKAEGQGGYRFEVEIVRRWAKKKHPIHEEKVRIEEISPKAVAFYAVAQQAYLEKRYDAAIDFYKQALADNPNHQGAQLGLAQALLDKKDLPVAVEAFEEAFKMDPNSAQPGLVACRLEMGEHLEKQRKFVEVAVHFRRVLELDPENRRLQEKLRVLYDQGMKAMNEKHWRRAIPLLERVVDIQPNYQEAAQGLKNARWEESQAAPSRRVKLAMGALLAVLLVGTGIASALTPGGLGGLLGKIDPTSLLGAATSPSITPSPATDVTQVTLQMTPTPAKEVTATATEASPMPSSSPSPLPTKTPTSSAPPQPTATPKTDVITSTLPIAVVTPTLTLTSPLPSYPAPELVAPDDKAAFTGKSSVPRLEWKPVGALGPDDQYVVTLEFQENGKTISTTIFGEVPGSETFWNVAPEFLDRVDASNPVFRWWVVVSHIATDAEGEEEDEGVDVSPVSGTRTFKWTTLIPTPIPSPIPLGEVETLDVDINPSNSSEIYAIVKGSGIYKTLDGGRRWQGIKEEKTIEALSIAPSTPSTLYAAAFGKVLKSEDGGKTWQESQIGVPAQVHALAIAPGNSKTLFIATNATLFKSDNGGQSWMALDKGAAKQVLNRPFYTVIVASPDGNYIYAAGHGDEVQWSRDAAGSPWSKYVCTVCTGNIYALAADPRDSNRIYVAGDLARLGVSKDGGGTWSQAAIPTPVVATLKFSTLAVDPHNPDIIYAGTGYGNTSDGQGLYRSTDGGLNWELFNYWTSNGGAGTYVQGIAFDSTDSRVIYIATSKGLYRSADQGMNWQPQ